MFVLLKTYHFKESLINGGDPGIVIRNAAAEVQVGIEVFCDPLLQSHVDGIVWWQALDAHAISLTAS